jgi:hypothetical protein
VILRRARKGERLLEQQQAREPEWQLESTPDITITTTETRIARVISIAELRQKLGLAPAAERARQQPMEMTAERPRVVRRREVVV